MIRLHHLYNSRDFLIKVNGHRPFFAREKMPRIRIIAQGMSICCLGPENCLTILEQAVLL